MTDSKIINKKVIHQKAWSSLKILIISSESFKSMSKQSLKPPSLLPASQGHAILLPQSLVNITYGNAEPHLMLQLYYRE